MIEPGDRFPDFDLPTDGGGRVRLADLLGRPFVIYFYPKDMTPGCTTEACDFRDRYERIAAMGAAVVGVSKDPPARHDRFKEKYGLPFTLASDEELTLHRAVGAWGVKKSYGREVEGTIRSTFLVDGSGVVRRAWRKVRVKGHVDQVLAALEEIAGGGA